MKEWKKYKLGELITLKYGKDHKKLNDGSFPVYGSGGVMRYGNDYIYDDSSILIPRKGSLNNIMFVDKPFWTVDTMFWSIIDQELVLPRFLYYTLCKYDFAGLNVGSAVPSLTVPVIESIEVVIPSIEKQKRILSLLVPLDDKIALNQRINDNLLVMAA
jgi:type I restriction enzyme S subunit